MTVDEFYDLLSEQLEDELNIVGADDKEIKHWIAVDDSAGFTISLVGEEAVPHEALAALVDGGASGAGYATYNPTHDVVVAEVLVGSPRNSDIRRAHVVRHGAALSLGPWEYTV